MLDLCAAPGGKATQLARRGRRGRAPPRRARDELEENCRRLGAANVHVVHADAPELPADLTGFDRALVDAPCSGLGVLASRPDLRWRAQPLPELQLELLRAAAERVRPGGSIVYSVCTINAEENEAVVDASGLEPIDLGANGRAFRHPRRPEFLPDAAARPPHVRLLRRPAAAAVRSRNELARLDPRGGGRAVALRGRLLAPRRADRALLDAGARVFHFDVGDGHFVPPVTIGPVVLRSIAPLVHAAGGVLDCHLMVDDPAHHFEQIARMRAATASPFISRRRTTRPVSPRAPAGTVSASGSRSTPDAPEEAAAFAASAAADLVLCMSDPSRVLGTGVHAGGARTASRGCASFCRTCPIQVDGGVGDGHDRAGPGRGGEPVRRR